MSAQKKVKMAQSDQAKPQTTTMLSDDYRKQLEEKHTTDDQWGNTGIAHYNTVLQLIDHFRAKTILDYGCGKGMIGERFRAEQTQPGSKYADVAFYEYDPGIEGKQDDTSTADIVICTDVMEHIEPDFLENVLADQARRTQKAIFLVISCGPAIHRLPDGRNAHLIIEHPKWWVEQLGRYFDVAKAEVKGSELYVLAAAKGAKMNPAPEPEDDKKKLESDNKYIKQAFAYIENKRYAKARHTILGIPDMAQEEPLGLFLLGRIAFETEDYHTAGEALFEYLKRDKNSEAFRMLGVSLRHLQRYKECLQVLGQPGMPEKFIGDEDYNVSLMMALNRLLMPEKTIQRYQMLKDNRASYLNCFLDALIILQKPDEAVAAAKEAVEQHPDDADQWALLGYVCDYARKFDDAEKAHGKTVELRPDHAASHSNLGLALIHNNKLDDAKKCFDRAIELDPRLMAAYLNRAGIHRVYREFDKEAADLETALEITPTDDNAQYGLGINLVKRERYTEGFARAEWFWHKPARTSYRLPEDYRRWYGEDLNGRSLLVFADQGIGDTMMMARYVRPLFEKYNPGKVLFAVDKKLMGFWKHQFGDLLDSGKAELFDKDQPETFLSKNPEFSAAIGSMSHIFDTEIGSIPAPEGYLKKIAPLNYKKDGKDFVIGLSWYSKSLEAGYKRSIALSEFSFLADYPNVRIINLQYGDTEKERMENAANGFEVFNDESVDAWADIQPFMDQVAGCDLVISIDNTTVHAAGAMGVPTWVILPYEAYWRWPVTGAATPWYDSLRLFRQQARNGDFKSTLSEIKTELDKVLNGDTAALKPPAFKPLFPARPKTKKAVLINDTGACFSWGNHAMSQGIKDALSEKGYETRSLSTIANTWTCNGVPTLQDFDDPKFIARSRYQDPAIYHAMENADAVIINGESMMADLRDTPKQLLYFAYVAKHHMGRKTGIINHSCFPEGGATVSKPENVGWYRKAYKDLDFCVVRDEVSLKILEMIQVPGTLGFDCAALSAAKWLSDHKTPKKTKDVIITAGPSYDSRPAEAFVNMAKALRKKGYNPIAMRGAKWFGAQEDTLFFADMEELADKLMECRIVSYDDYMTMLSSAAMVVTGFYQTAVIAHMAGTPVLPMTSTSNVSMPALAQECGWVDAIPYLHPDLDKGLSAKALEILAGKQKSFSDIKALEKRAQANFDAL